MGIFDAYYAKKVKISYSRAEKQFASCPFCNQMLNAAKGAICPGCGEDLSEVQAVSFSCNEEHNEDLVKEINNWLENYTVRQAFNYDVDTDSDANGKEFYEDEYLDNIKDIPLSDELKEELKADSYEYAEIEG